MSEKKERPEGKGERRGRGEKRRRDKKEKGQRRKRGKKGRWVEREEKGKYLFFSFSLNFNLGINYDLFYN